MVHMFTPLALDGAIHLRQAGVSVVLALAPQRLPSIAYWGQDLGDLTQAQTLTVAGLDAPPWSSNLLDERQWLSILPEVSVGWMGTPGLTGSRTGRSWTTRFVTTDVAQSVTDQGAQRIDITGVDADAQLSLVVVIELTATGLLRSRASVTNDSAQPYQVDDLHLAYPVPARAAEVLDLAGRWTKERAPQRMGFPVGSHVREQRQGRTGCDGSLVSVAGTPTFGFRTGEVWGIHLGWSGNHRIAAERTLSGERVLAAGELLWSGEIQLDQGDTYESPWLYGSYSPAGMDAMSVRFHEHLRARATYPRGARPVSLNVWEAVYFDHDLERLIDLADRAADLGVERYVLDDGWFGGRRDDHAGLGDWEVSTDMWPGETLKVLSDYVRARGMEFGIWFEPEMINLDSDSARNHPEWVLKPDGRMPIAARNQQVLDLANPEAYAYLLGAMVHVIETYNVDYIKVDHNRPLLESASQRTGQASVHDQTLAIYQLFDELRLKFPTLEIETCSSGGGRIDLEILERSDRVWASDCIDAHERQDIQRWTNQLIPHELLGSHVGDGKAHTTGRMHDIDFRAGTALFGHFGIEWDLAKASESDLESLGDWIAVYKQYRGLLHSGAIVRSDETADGAYLHGVVAHDQREGIFAFVIMERNVTWPIGRMQIPGLAADKNYRVSVVKPTSTPDPVRQMAPWMTQEVTATGQMLGSVGLTVPGLFPDNLVVFHVSEVQDGNN